MMTDFFEILAGDKCKRSNNKYAALMNLIWQNGISRKELAQELNISKVAITRSIDQLIDWGFVEEAGQSVSGSRGRRPIPLALTKDLFYSLGISMQYESTKIALLNARSDTVSEIIVDDMPAQWQAKCDYLIDKAKSLISANDISYDNVVGVGIALTGIVNPTSGIVISSSQFPDDKNFNLLEYLNQQFEKQCILINTSHLSAYLEHKWGKAGDMSSFIYFNTGFALGMFMNGQLYRGHQCHAGEVGAMQINLFGSYPQGDYGQGTLWGTTPFFKIPDRILEIINNNGKTLVRNYLPEGCDKVTFDMIVNAIADGDQLCAQMVSEQFEIVSRVLLNLAYVFNPEAIFLPTWTAKCPAVSVDVVRRMMGHYGYNNWELEIEILSAKCGEDDMARGVALLPIEHLFGNKL